jgi:flagellar hook-basal body complex protein FliE
MRDAVFVIQKKRRGREAVMSEIKINGPGAVPGSSLVKASAKVTEGGFDNIMQDAIGKLSQVRNDAEKAVKELATGGDMTQAIVSMEKADMSFNLMVEVRNKLLSAYEEIMRMQV